MMLSHVSFVPYLGDLVLVILQLSAPNISLFCSSS